MKSSLRNLLIAPLVFLFIINSFAGTEFVNGTQPGMKVNILESRLGYTKIEYIFGGYITDEIKINGNAYLSFYAPDMSMLMEKGFPQLLTYRNSLLIPDNAAMNYRILEQDIREINTIPVMPSKGHFTRDIDPNTVPYVFSQIYSKDEWYPSIQVSLDEPYIVRDFRGQTIQLNPMQYNAVQGKLRVVKRIVLEIYTDNSLEVKNPLTRYYPLTKVSSEFSGLYRGLFMNYGLGDTRFDSIPEPGRMLVIYATDYATTIQPFVQWKQSRGLTVLTAEYPTQTGSGNTSIKTYIQNLYNTPDKITYIVLVGESNQIPTLNGAYESAPSDPCYVKLAGTDAYPDAFISRISCANAASVNYVIQKLIKFERDIDYGAPWYNKGTGIGGPDVGGTPSYADSIRMNWVRDTLLAGGFTHVDKVNGPVATPQTLINVLNDGRYVLNYIGHGSGTSWSNTNFAVTNAYQLNNGWKNPFLVDVACLNGNFTLGECLAEALLRAGDTANPKGCSSIYASSTNASWVPPCDMQMYAMRLMAHQWRKTAGAMSFFGVMKAMDMWGGSSGEGLKLMEQYNIFGDCSLLLTRGVPLGPSISHNPLPNTENMTGPYVINATVNTVNSPLLPGRTKLFWTRGTVFSDSIVMTNTSGINWTASITGNGLPAIYKYYIVTCDSMGRGAKAPGNAPEGYFSFTASPDTIKPSITHTPLSNTPRNQWPASVSASVTDNIGVDSVWVRWYKNTPSNGIKHFRLNASGNQYQALFNSVISDVNYNDSIFYRVFARDNSLAHNTDSTVQNNFKIIAQTTAVVGTGSVSSNYPFTTYWMDGRTDMLYTAAEIIAAGGGAGAISQIGFNVITADPAPLNGFNVKIQSTTATTVTNFVTTGWTVCYSGTYTVPGTGWQYITLTSPFVWDGTSNLLVEVCYNNSAYTQYSPVNATTISNMAYGRYNDLSTGDGCTASLTSGTGLLTARPNMGFVINLITGNERINPLIPENYALEQNYPNPFNPVTKINYAIPKQGLVSLKIYDILGREVKTLVNEIKQPGFYTVEFNGSELSSGVYFYRLQSSSYTDVKRMIMIK